MRFVRSLLAYHYFLRRYLYFNKKSNDLTYLTKQNGRWISNFVTNTNDEGYSFQIKIDDLGVIHTCYWVSDKGLAYRRKSNGIWRQPHYIEDNPKMGLFPSMEVTSDGKPHISFYDQTTKTLKYAYLDDNEWHVEIIDDRGNVGKYSSLVIDQKQSKHIVYYDETNTALKYAHEVNGGWDTNVIDDGGDMGKNSSIFLDSKGFLHVSYYDATAEDLKYGVYRP